MNAVIIAGPRDLFPTDLDIRDALHFSNFRPVDVIISGYAKGVDRAAYSYAKKYDYIPITVEPRWEWWKKRGSMRVAGHERNGIMAALRPKGIILIKRRGVETPGTTNMEKQGQANAIETFTWRLS